MWAGFRSAVAAVLCWLLVVVPVKADAQVAQALQTADSGLFGTLPSVPKTPAQLQQYLVMRGMSAVLGDTLPVKLDAKSAFPTVEDNALPGGAFHGKPLELTADNLTRPLPAGDWTVQALAFCQEYSIHQPGAGTAYKIGPLQGTKAEVIATFLWRGVLAGKSPSELQLVEWSIESGTPYYKMPKSYQADIDQLIPSYKDQLQGSWVEQPDAKYNSIVAKPAEILKIAPVPGLGLASRMMVHAMPTPPPTFGDFLKKYGMGKAGDLYADAKNLSDKFTKPYTDEQLRAQEVFAGQGSKLPPVPAQNGPWTVKANGVYMRFIVHGGNLQSNNELQIRVTAPPQPVAQITHRAHLTLASYQPQAVTPTATAAQQATLLSLMGVSLAGPGFAVAGRTVTALEALELTGVVLSGAEIAFAVGVGAQALIIVLPMVLHNLKNPPVATPTTTTVAKTKSSDDTCRSDKSIPDGAFVVRGGVATPDQIANASGVSPMEPPAGAVDGVSVQSAAGKGIHDLAAPVSRYRQISVSTVGAVRAEGGNVYPTPGAGYHAHLCGLTPDMASKLLLMGQQPNPAFSGR